MVWQRTVKLLFALQRCRAGRLQSALGGRLGLMVDPVHKIVTNLSVHGRDISTSLLLGATTTRAKPADACEEVTAPCSEYYTRCEHCQLSSQ
jgi:hypothetical protein